MIYINMLLKKKINCSKEGKQRKGDKCKLTLIHSLTFCSHGDRCALVSLCLSSGCFDYYRSTGF